MDLISLNVISILEIISTSESASMALSLFFMPFLGMVWGENWNYGMITVRDVLVILLLSLMIKYNMHLHKHEIIETRGQNLKYTSHSSLEIVVI